MEDKQTEMFQNRFPLNANDIYQLLTKKRMVCDTMVDYMVDHIVEKLEKPSLFRFYFLHFLKLKNIEKTTKIIKTTLFPPKVRIHPELEDFYLKEIYPDLKMMITVLESILNDGWRNMPKTDYSLVSMFYLLCKSMYELDMTSPNHFFEINRFLQTEKYLLSCMQSAEHPGAIQSIILSYMKRSEKTQEDMEMIEKYFKKIFSAENNAYSLRNLILAMNMAEYRRSLTMFEISNPMPSFFPNNFSYSAPPEVQSVIRSLIRETIVKTTNLFVDKDQWDKSFQYIENYVKIQSSWDVHIDYAPMLILFRLGEDGKPRSTLKEHEDVVQNGIQLYDGFTMQSILLLTSTIEIEDMGLTQIFSEETFSNDIKKMQTTNNELSKKAYQCQKINRNRYTLAQRSDPEHRMSPIELSTVSTLIELSDMMLGFSHKLIDLIENYREMTDVASDQVLTVLSARAFVSQRYNVPFWHKKILTPCIYAGKTIGEALRMITTLSMMTALYYNHSEINNLIQKKSSVIKEIDSAQRILEQYCDPIEYAILSKRYHWR